MIPDLAEILPQRVLEPLRVWGVAGSHAAPPLKPTEASFHGVARPYGVQGRRETRGVCVRATFLLACCAHEPQRTQGHG